MYRQGRTLAMEEVEPLMDQILPLVTVRPVIITSPNIGITITTILQYITNSLPIRVTMVIQEKMRGPQGTFLITQGKYKLPPNHLIITTSRNRSRSNTTRMKPIRDILAIILKIFILRMLDRTIQAGT